jgi:hypothetical protein
MPREHLVRPVLWDQNVTGSVKALAKVSLLERVEQKWHTPSVSSPSTVVSPELPVRIGLSDSM